MTTVRSSPYEKGSINAPVTLPERLHHLAPRSNNPEHDPSLGMDFELHSEPQPTTVIYRKSTERSRPSSWHSQEDGSTQSGERPSTSLGLSRSRSYSGTQSASQDSHNASRGVEDPLFHAAFRLFKASMKEASEKYGPYLPPDDGSPFLTHRLNRMWNDLSSEQRSGWYARASGDTNVPLSDSMRDAGSSYSPILHHLGGGAYSGGSPAASAKRTHFPVSDTGAFEYTKMETSEVHSPYSVTSDEPYGGSSTLHSRSQSPTMGEAPQSNLAHIPRPPNAWILFRSTMSKSRRPDGAVYSPPEISIMWAELPKHERDVWYERAKEAKLQHEAANPGYKYHPRKKPYNSRRPTESLAAVSSNSSSRLPRPPLAPHSHSASQV